MEGGSLKITRVLNTNAVVTLDREGREVIVTGPGIGFQKKKGEHVEERLVDKTYQLQNSEDSRRLQQIVKSISEQYLDIAGKVVDMARNEYQLKVNDVLYITLTDHIHSAVERLQAGIALKNMMKMDIRRFYKKEFAIGQQAVRWVCEKTGIDLGEDEAAFIAMHIMTSELDNSEMLDVRKITELMNAILQIVKFHFKIELREESFSYQRFVTHLKFFAARVFDRTVYQDSMKDIYQALVTQNGEAYSGVRKVADYIKKQYGYPLSIDEQLYLLIHIKRILDEEREGSSPEEEE